MDTIKAHCESEAQEFYAIIVKLIPYYLQMVRALTDALIFPEDAKIRVLDLGCGTGTIAAEIVR